MDLLATDSIFILLGALVGFGQLLTSLLGCLFSAGGSTTLKFVMVPFFLCYLYNSTTLAFYMSHMFISYLPETNKVLAYVHNGVKLILSVVITVFAAKIWESFRLVANCVRFSECDQSYMFVVHGLTNFTDLACGQVRPDWSNDGCRRWLAQMPLICLSLMSIVVIHAVGQLWDDKFGDPADRVVVQPKSGTNVDQAAVVVNPVNQSPTPPPPKTPPVAAPADYPPQSTGPPRTGSLSGCSRNKGECCACSSHPHRPCCPCHCQCQCPCQYGHAPYCPPYYPRPPPKPRRGTTRKRKSRSKSGCRTRSKSRSRSGGCRSGQRGHRGQEGKKQGVSLERVLRETIRR